MPPTKLYTDFLEKEPQERRGKFPPHNITSYVDISCPHCKKVIAEIPEQHVAKVKSTKCIQHLRVCPEYKDSVPPAPEKKKDPSNAELLQRLEEAEKRRRQDVEESEKRAEARHQEMLARIGRAHGLPPPDPMSEDDLNRRLLDKQKDECKRARREERKRKRSEDASLRAAQSLRLDDVQKKRLRAALHPDGKDESQSAALKHFRDLFGL